MNKAKMTFKFNTSKSDISKPAQESSIVVQEVTEETSGGGASHTAAPTAPANVVPFTPYANDYGAWDPSFDEETNRIEQIIRQSDPQHRLQEKKPDLNGANVIDVPTYDFKNADADHDGYEPEFVDAVDHAPNQEHQEYQAHQEQQENSASSYYRKSHHPSWLKVAASVAGAIVTGVIFGFVVLSIFQGDIQMPGLATKQVVKEAVTANGQAVTEQAVSAGNGAGNGAALAVSAQQAFQTAVKSEAKSYYMLQYGVFKDAAGVNAAEQELLSKGMAAFGDTTDQNRVYAGIANAKEDAMLFAQALKAQGVELYVRELTLPATTQIAYQGEAKAMEQFLKQSDQVVRLLLQMSVAQLEKSEPLAFTQAELVALKNSHQQWTELASKAAVGLPEEAKQSWSSMTQSMNTAIISLNEYGKKLSSAHLWGLQSAVMQFIMAEKQYIEKVS